MAWVRIDDHFDEHPKLAAVGPIGWGVWLAGLAYCNRNLTDGFIPHSVAESIGGRWRVRIPQEDGREQVWSITRSSGMVGDDIDTEWVIGLLIEAGLWEEVAGGYLVHDYHNYQPSKAEILAEREQKQLAGKKGGLASAQARAQAKSKQVLKQVLKQNSSTCSSKIQAEFNPNPNPNPNPLPVPNTKPKPRKPKTHTSPSGAVAAEKPAAPPCPAEAESGVGVVNQPDKPTPNQVVGLWNEICGDAMPRADALTQTRREKIQTRARLPDRDESWWRAYFERIRGSPFCCGAGPRRWRATLDWAVKSEDVVARVLEGQFDEEVMGGGGVGEIAGAVAGQGGRIRAQPQGAGAAGRGGQAGAGQRDYRGGRYGGLFADEGAEDAGEAAGSG